MLKAMPTAVSAIVTETASASGSKKNRHDRITIGRPAKISSAPADSVQRLPVRYSATFECGENMPGRWPSIRVNTSAMPAGNR